MDYTFGETCEILNTKVKRMKKKLSSCSNNNNTNILYSSNWKVDSWNQKNLAR